MKVDDAKFISLQLAKRLYNIIAVDNVITRLQQNNYYENPSYLSEYPSIIIFLCYLYGIESIDIDRHDMLKNIDYYVRNLVNAIKANANNNSSLCYGLCGIAHAFSYCFKYTGLYKNILDVIETRLVDTSNIKLSHIRENGYFKTKESDYDVIQGLSSVALYFLKKKDITENQHELILRILQYFVELFDFSDNAVNIIIKPEEMVPSYLIDEYPLGYINLGISHGIIAPLYSLCLGYNKLKLSGSYNSAIGNGIDIYRKNYWVRYDIKHKAELYGWPERIDIGNKKHCGNYNQSWCYGSLGIARVLFMIAKMISDKELQSFCVRVIKCVLNYPTEKAYQQTNAICHGQAGKMMVFDEMFNDTGDKVFHMYAQNIFENIVSCATVENKYVFLEKDVYFRGKIYNNAIEYIDLGLLNGNTGIIMALLGHAFGNYKPLNEIFIS